MNDVAHILRKNGCRLTSQRQYILSVLTPQPQSVRDVITSLHSQGIRIDKVTVYRTLDRLVELGIVGKIQFKDKTAKFELLTEMNHHHHLVCDLCG